MSDEIYCMCCDNNNTENPDLTFFKLPEEIDVVKKWIKFCGIDDEDFDIDQNCYMCSEHFSSDQFECFVDSQKILIPGSVPCLKGPPARETIEQDNAGTTTTSAKLLETEVPARKKILKRSSKNRKRPYHNVAISFLWGRPYRKKGPYSNRVGKSTTSIRSASSKGYKAARSLEYWQSKETSPGINSAMIELVMYFMEDTGQKQKICSLIFKEIYLSPAVHIDESKTDSVVGFVDIGKLTTDELTTDELPTDELTTTALVCMARGVQANWEHVIGYWFLNDEATKKFLYSIVLDSIDKVQKSGLKVKAIICDQRPDTESLAERLNISTEQSFFLRNGEKIYFIYDVPDLLQSIRNSLAKYDLEYLGKTVSWKHIQSACTTTHPFRSVCLRKITSKHLEATTDDVRHAAQILSETVSVAILVLIEFKVLPREWRITSHFIKDIDKAFDCLNSSKLKNKQNKMRYAMSETSPHREILIKIRDNLKSAKFLSEDAPPCINGFIISINSILQLSNDLRNIYKIPKLRTGRLNQDPIYDFFDTVRKQNDCEYPTPLEFEYSIRFNYLSEINKFYLNKQRELLQGLVMLASTL